MGNYTEYHESEDELMWGRFDGVPIPDPQNTPIVAYCECGAEIYEEGHDRCLECEELGEIPFDEEEED